MAYVLAVLRCRLVWVWQLNARVRALEETVQELKWRWVMPLALLMPLLLLWLATLAH